MTIFGIGLKFAFFSFLFFLFILSVHYYFYPIFVIESIPYALLILVGILLLSIGVPIWILAARSVVKGFSEGKLVTDNVYAICRHPLYGNGIFYTFPGILLFFKSYVLFTLPVFMYFLFKLLIKKEEAYLLETFGDAFVNYANRVNMVFPKFWKLAK